MQCQLNNLKYIGYAMYDHINNKKCYILSTYYRVNKKSLCTWWLQYKKLQVMLKMPPANLQTFIDMPNCVLQDRVHYSTVHTPNVFCDVAETV
jgi:hypothetical protein